jgi:hypothetical protein
MVWQLGPGLNELKARQKAISGHHFGVAWLAFWLETGTTLTIISAIWDLKEYMQ